jgi:hypothetical protein
MMIVMKWISMLVLTAGFLCAQTLQSVKSVYLFPMRNGFDQYLAGRLTEQHLFQVVADPKAADAVFTDRVGPSFEQMFNERLLDAKAKTGDEAARSSLGGGKGNLFLVSKSKQVIWSAFDPPNDMTPKAMEKAARRSVDRLKKDLAPVKVTVE